MAEPSVWMMAAWMVGRSGLRLVGKLVAQLVGHWVVLKVDGTAARSVGHSADRWAAKRAALWVDYLAETLAASMVA